MELNEIYAHISDVNGGFTHQDYEHTVTISDEYRAHLTGVGIGAYLKQFNRREDEKAFEQRVLLTEAISMPSLEKTLNTFNKIYRTEKIKKDFIFEDKKEKPLKSVTEIKKAQAKFYNPQSLEHYLNEKMGFLNFSDPNTFIVVDFNDFDPNNEKASPRPVEYYSPQVKDFQYIQKDLQYLTTDIEFEFIQWSDGKRSVHPAHRYFIYTKQYAIKFEPVEKLSNHDDTPVRTEDGEIIDPKIVVGGENSVVIGSFRYDVTVGEHKAGDIQAVRVGYNPDKETNGRTMASPYAAAMPFFRKMLKTVSEFDLTMALHAFPQKFSVLPRCTGKNMTIGCVNGSTINGDKCDSCNGTGFAPVHTSGQDTVYMPMGRTADELPDLTKLAVYVSPPIEIVRFQKEVTSDLLEQIDVSIFNGERRQKNAVEKREVEVLITRDNMNDTLFTFAEGYSFVYKYITHRIAEIVDVTDLDIVEYEFPKDFKLESTNELIRQYSEAETGNLPAFAKRQLELNIAKKIYSNDRIELTLFELQQQYDPLSGEGLATVQYASSNNLILGRDEFIFFNIKKIFDDIRNNHLDILLEQDQATQFKMIDEKVVDALYAEFQKEGEIKSPAFNIDNLDKLNDETDDDE